MKHFSLGHAVLLCAAFVGAQIVFAIPLAIAGIALDLPLASNPLCLAGVNILAFGFTVGLAWVMDRQPLRQLWSFRPIPAAALLAIVIATLGAIVLYSEIDNLVRTVLPVPEWMEKFFEGFAQAAEHPLAGVVLLVVVAPITEELLFRGIILNGLLTRFRAPTAILVSTVLFMLVHLNPWQFAAAAGLGIMAGWLYVRTRSLMPCLSVHVIQNGMVCLVPWLPFQIEGFTDSDFFGTPSHQPLWFNAVGAGLLVMGLVMLWRFCPERPPELPAAEPNDESSERRAASDLGPPPLLH
jgi:membrane protease YdiL (CAAX protease family)